MKARNYKTIDNNLSEFESLSHQRENLLNERETAGLLGVTASCMQAWRYRGGGPRFVQISARCIRYRPSDLHAFIETRLRLSTSDQGEEGAA